MTAPLARFGDWLRGLNGWRRLLAGFAAGAVSALGFAPLNVFFALLAGYALLAVLMEGACAQERARRSAAWLGWAFGFGQFLIGLHWIGYPFLVDVARHGWQMPFAVLFMSGGLALFPCLACFAAAWLWRADVGRLLVLTACLSADEWLRGHVFTGFPWNLSAYGWGASLEILQSASIVGAYGLSLLTILLGTSLSELLAPRLRWRLPAACTVLFCTLWVWGAWRLSADKPEFVAGVDLRIVQPNIPQNEKDDRSLMERNWRRLLTLSQSAPGSLPTHIIWPEAAPPFLLESSPQALSEISSMIAPDRVLITGAVRRVLSPDGQASYFNSLFVFGADGVQVYDKFHLVPFGEYVPFATALNAIGITKLTAGQAGFSAGTGPRTLEIPNAPAAGPLICYEIIFPGEVSAESRPQWFVNVTNDAWFGPWAGPRQHLLSARVRAIEEGIPVVRAANTGISAVIDGSGRLLASLPLNQMATLDSKLPKSLAQTPYSRFGDVGFFILLIVSAAYGTARVLKRRTPFRPNYFVSPRGATG